MALGPPDDFRLLARRRVEPRLGELLELWDRREVRRRERARAAMWREVVEGVRRDAEGCLRAVEGFGGVSGSVGNGRVELGPRSRAALRPVPRCGRVFAAGVDTWSPCWYADAGSGLAKAMACLAVEGSGRAYLVPGKVGGYRFGWFPDWGLVFGEGRPSGDQLCGAADLSAALDRVEGLMVDLGIPVGQGCRGGLRRMDVAVDLWTGSGLEGLVFLECVGAASMGVGKVATYRGGRRVESVLLKTRRGRSQGRVYDKGWESGGASVGRWIRLEGQWRFRRTGRLEVGELDWRMLRDRFRRRFLGLWQAAGGFRVGGLDLVVERVLEAVEDGRLRESRARALVGYLVLSVGGVAQGSKRTVYELERECRELGLAVSFLEGRQTGMDVASVLEECMAVGVWRSS